jgi:hypothetical protein
VLGQALMAAVDLGLVNLGCRDQHIVVLEHMDRPCDKEAARRGSISAEDGDQKAPDAHDSAARGDGVREATGVPDDAQTSVELQDDADAKELRELNVLGRTATTSGRTKHTVTAAGGAAIKVYYA